MESRRIQTAGKRPSAGGNGKIVSPGQTGDAVQKNGHILTVLHQTFRPLNHHLGDAFVVLRQLVKGRIDDLPFSPTMASLISVTSSGRSSIKKNDQMHVPVVTEYGLGYLL